MLDRLDARGRSAEPLRLWLPEREHVRLGAGLVERDLESPVAHLAVLPHELVQAPLLEQPVAVLVDIDAVRGAGSLAVDQHAEGNRRVRSGRQYEMRVARVEAVGDAPAVPVEHNILPPDRPLAGEGPVVEPEALGELVAAAFVERSA